MVANLAMAHPEPESSNATYFNDAETPGADPFVLNDPDSGYYYAYSTEGSDSEHHFAIYRSPDLSTWQRLSNGALPIGEAGSWARDWFWAPEVYHNPNTGKYFLFYSARLRHDQVAAHFRFADFEEPSKIGVAVADSPAGPFREVGDGPLDYHPYDPRYHDVNQIMDETQRKPPETLAEGRTAPLGTYLPAIDPNVFFDDGRIYLYFSRNAYRNWVWDTDLDKYIEEASIYAVELDAGFWHDPTASTAPRIAPAYRDVNRAPGDPSDARKDGFTPILNYGGDKQDWENAHVHDYARSGGREKDRRWEEGSTTVKARTTEGRPVYYLLFSANNFQNEHYGVGYAVSEHPLGPWQKSPENPVLRENVDVGMYSTGHGSVVSANGAGNQLYYVHHGRPAMRSDRRLYTAKMSLDPDAAVLHIDQSTQDEPVPVGVAPYRLRSDARIVDVTSGERTVRWSVRTRDEASMALEHPANRVVADISPGEVASVDVSDDHAVVRGETPGTAVLTLRYQRRKANGQFEDIVNFDPAASERPRPVTTSVVVRNDSA